MGLKVRCSTRGETQLELAFTFTIQKFRQALRLQQDGSAAPQRGGKVKLRRCPLLVSVTYISELTAGIFSVRSIIERYKNLNFCCKIQTSSWIFFFYEERIFITVQEMQPSDPFHNG